MFLCCKCCRLTSYLVRADTISTSSRSGNRLGMNFLALNLTHPSSEFVIMMTSPHALARDIISAVLSQIERNVFWSWEGGGERGGWLR